MRSDKNISVVIPALNEEHSIGKVIAAIPSWVNQIVVADNESTDATAEVAVSAGATVITESMKGYGEACFRGIENAHDAAIIVFLDADFSDHPEEMALLVDPIIEGKAQLVIGSRTLGVAQNGSLTPQQYFGNAFACFLIKMIWGKTYTDLGPFRAISASALHKIKMRDRGFGWTVEMQIRAIQEGMTVQEVPVSYRKRIGKSKISGTIKGTFMAGTIIIKTILSSALSGSRS